MSAVATVGNTHNSENCLNNPPRPGRLHQLTVLAKTLFWRPVATTTTLSYRIVRQLTWVPGKCGVYKALGYSKDSEEYFTREYYKAIKASRDFFGFYSTLKAVCKDLVAQPEEYVDDIKPKAPEDYLLIEPNYTFYQYSSYFYGYQTFRVIIPPKATTFPAPSDGALNTVMASFLFKPGVMGINFGVPNVASFITKQEGDNCQTYKVDAKSLYRQEMTFHATNGKLQSGLFFVATNLPEEAMARFEQSAEALEGNKNITCVNTNCLVLQQAGFSIEGVKMADIVLPTAFMEILLFRNVFYTDSQGVKHKVYFDLVNTSGKSLKHFYEEIDTAVISTRERHRRRNADTEENSEARGALAKALIAKEKAYFEARPEQLRVDDSDLAKRQVSISVPTLLGETVARIWGRHTLYEVDFSKDSDKILRAYDLLSQEEIDRMKLLPFVSMKPGFITSLKRNVLFSGQAIRFLRRHMMGRVDSLFMRTQGLLGHLKSTKGEHLNYVLMDDRVVIARVDPNRGNNRRIRAIADWVLSKHALLSGRQEVLCSGELWYDESEHHFIVNNDSGTYAPSAERVEVAVRLFNELLDTQRFGSPFIASQIT